MKTLIFFISAFFLMTGCAMKQGFDRGALKQNLYGASVEITEDAIKKALELKPQIRVPFKLGVYFLERYRYGWRYGKSGWEGNDKALEWLHELKHDGLVSDIIPIHSSTITDDGDERFYRDRGPRLKSLRLAAARHNADAILIIDYEPLVDRYNNFSSFLYLSIIGGFFVPGTYSDALVMMNGALWDVRNEYLYLTVEVEGEVHRIGTAFLLKDRESVRMAKQEALALFREEMVRRIRTLQEK